LSCAEISLQEADDFRIFCSNHPEEATLPLRCLATASSLWTCRPGTIAGAIILGQQVLECSLQIHILVIEYRKQNFEFSR